MDTVSSGTTVHLVKLVPPSTQSDLEFLHLLQERTKILQDPILQGSYQYVEKLIITLGLAQTLRDYPHAAGRLSCDPKTQEWSIKLMNDGRCSHHGGNNQTASEEWFHNVNITLIL